MTIRRGWLGLLAGSLIVSTGCVATTVKENQFISRKQAVVVDRSENEEVFIVDMETGKVFSVDLDRAKPYRPSDSDD